MDHIWDQLGGQFGDQPTLTGNSSFVNEQMGVSAWGPNWGSTWGSAWESAWRSAWGSAWGPSWGTAGDQLGDHNISCVQYELTFDKAE